MITRRVWKNASECQVDKHINECPAQPFGGTGQTCELTTTRRSGCLPIGKREDPKAPVKIKLFKCPVQPGSAKRGKVKTKASLEDQLASELECTSIGSRGNLACLTTVEPSVEATVLSGATKLRVVPGVEGVGAELKS